MTTKPKTKTRKIKPIVSIPPIIADDISISVNPELPKTMPMIDVLREEAAKSETICDKARRLGKEKLDREVARQAKRDQEALAKKQAFLDQFGLTAGFGLTAELDPKYVYQLCGRLWLCRSLSLGEYYYLSPIPNQYLGWYTLSDRCVFDLEDLGRALIEMDQREAELRVKYPPTWWNRLKTWCIKNAF